MASLFGAQLPFDLPEVKSHTYPKGHGFIVRKLDGQRVVDAKSWGIPNRMPGKRPGTFVVSTQNRHSYESAAGPRFKKYAGGEVG